MFGLQKWQLYGLAAIAGYFIYQKYFAAPAAPAQGQLPAPAATSTTAAFPMQGSYY